jgi:hypothetical protein
MNERLLVFVIILSLIFSGCISTQSHQAEYNQSKQDQEWISNTVTMLEKSRGIDGGYSDFSPQISSLYSTYYFLSCLEILGNKVKYREETIDFLLLKEQDILKPENSINIDDIYFLTMSLDILNTEPENKSELISKVMLLQSPDGSFAYSKGENGTLQDTFRALQTLNILGADLNDMPTTRIWLIEEWKNIDERESLLSLTSDTSLLISSLELCNIDVLSSEEYTQEINWLVKQRTSIEFELESLPESEMDLITLESFTEFLLITGDISPKLKSIVGTYLKSKQLPDGSYNVFHEEYGEPQGTYLALLLASNIGTELNNDASEFIYDHELLDKSGGFRPSYRLISSTENTYLAVQSLKILNQEIPNEDKLYIYLENQLRTNKKEPKSVYYSVATLKLLNQELANKNTLIKWIEPQMGDIANKPVEDISADDIFNLMHLVKTANDLGMNINEKNIIIEKMQGFQQNDGGFGFDSSDIFMTYYIVAVLNELDADPLNKELCISWIKEGQTDDGGFIFRRGVVFTNSSDIYSTYISLSCLNILKAEPKYPENLQRWLDDCKINSGGFAFTTSDSDLNSTFNPSEASLETTAWGLMAYNHIATQIE